MPGLRCYGDPCGLSRALDLVGERWSLLIVRELLFGPKRFTDLRSGVPGASPNVLAQRLRELENARVVRRQKLPPPAASSVYELTDRGRELEDAMIHLARWGSGTPVVRGAELSNDALLLALKTMFEPRRAEGVRTIIELRLDGVPFRIAVRDCRIDIAQTSADDAEAILETDVSTMRGLVFGRRSPAAVQRSGRLRFIGQRSVGTRFLKLFTMPRVRSA